MYTAEHICTYVHSIPNTSALCNVFFHHVVPSLPPTDIEVVSVSSDSVIVQWDMVPCNGQHGPIHGYHIQYMPTTGHSTEVYHRSTNESMVTLSDLSPYTNYSVTVTPYNSAGNGTRPIQLQIQTNESGT